MLVSRPSRYLAVVIIPIHSFSMDSTFPYLFVWPVQLVPLFALIVAPSRPDLSFNLNTTCRLAFQESIERKGFYPSLGGFILLSLSAGAL